MVDPAELGKVVVTLPPPPPPEFAVVVTALVVVVDARVVLPAVVVRVVVTPPPDPGIHWLYHSLENVQVYPDTQEVPPVHPVLRHVRSPS